MAATKLILHHRYSGGIAFDFSDHANHGAVAGAQLEHSGPSAGTLRFDDGPDRVDVVRSESTNRIREFHIQVRFRYQQPGGHQPFHRMNLVEGEGSFALFVETDFNIGATSRWVSTGPGTSATGWAGIFTAMNSVSHAQWHTVDYLFDGIGHSRVVLDGALIGERWDHPAPIQPMSPRGITIGHWPGDDRYTLNGHIAEVKMWRDEPERDPGRNLEDCCLDKGWVDERVAEARRAGWDLERTLAAVDDLNGALRAVAGAVRGGDRARTLRIQEATRDAMAATRLGSRPGFAVALSTLRDEIDGSLTPTQRDHHAQAILDSLLAGPAGLWLSRDDPARTQAFLAEALDAACMGDVVPPRRKKPPREEPEVPQPDGGDPDTDAGVPPWAAGQPKDPPPWRDDRKDDERDDPDPDRKDPGRKDDEKGPRR